MLSDLEYFLTNYEPKLLIKSKSCIQFNQYVGSRKKRLINQPKNNLNQGLLSQDQRGRIRNYVDLLIEASKWKRVINKTSGADFKFKVNFITLTIPTECKLDDKIFHLKVFKPFIRAFKEKCQYLLYLYKAEVTDAGRLHYHLTTNSYIYTKTLTALWNRHLNNAGLIDLINNANPNSTHIKAIINIDTLGCYLSDYFTKKDLYKSNLKRYFKMYRKKLKYSTESSCKLPKNYFKSLKRKLSVKLWDCSILLKETKCIVPLVGKYEIDYDKLNSEVVCIKKEGMPYKIFPLTSKERDFYKSYKEAWNESLKRLRDYTKMQSNTEYI